MFSFLLVSVFSSSHSKRHGRAEDKYEEDTNSFGYNSFLGDYDRSNFGENEYTSYDYEEDQSNSIAEKYLANFDQLQTKEEKYQVIAWALTELAASVDKSATRNEIEFGVGGEIHQVLNSVDARDREMKKQFQELQAGIDQLRQDIDVLVNGTRTELQNQLKIARKEVMNSLKEIVAKSIEQNSIVANDVNAHLGKSVSKYKDTSTKKAIIYFVGFQVLLFLCVYFYSRYIKEIRLD